MPTAAAVRFQIEAALAQRIPSALTPRAKTVHPVAPTGVVAVDALLEGGLPLGAISELVGPECSGRTSLALSLIAQITQAGRVCAWVDVCDGLDPESAAATGVDLERLLWVRCGAGESAEQARAASTFRLHEGYFAAPAIKKGLHGGGFGPHPRTEVKGLSDAVGEFLHTQRRDANKADTQPKISSDDSGGRVVMARTSSPNEQQRQRVKPWTRIEQALRVTDLLLQAGGFAAIVLDMAGVAPEYATRVPLASWFRYRAAAERTQTCLLLLGQHACAKSSGEVLLRFAPGTACDDEATLFTGIRYQVLIERRRFAPATPQVVSMRKPPQRETCAEWRSRAGWAGAR